MKYKEVQWYQNDDVYAARTHTHARTHTLAEWFTNETDMSFMWHADSQRLRQVMRQIRQNFNENRTPHRLSEYFLLVPTEGHTNTGGSGLYSLVNTYIAISWGMMKALITKRWHKDIVYNKLDNAIKYRYWKMVSHLNYTPRMGPVKAYLR